MVKDIYKGNECDETIPSLEVNNKIVANDLDKANTFNEFFCSVTSLDTSGATLPERARVCNFGMLENIVINENDVMDQLLILNTNKFYIPDNISPKCLKVGASVLALIFTHIFNHSLRSASFPTKWKQANVIPILKKEN